MNLSPLMSTDDKKHSALCRICLTVSSYLYPINPERSSARPSNLLECLILTRRVDNISSSSGYISMLLDTSSGIKLYCSGVEGQCGTFLFSVARSCLILRIISLFTSCSCHPDCLSGVNQYLWILIIGSLYSWACFNAFFMLSCTEVSHM